MYIKWGDRDKNSILIPVNPSSYELNGKQQNTSVNVHGFGEVNLKGKRGLMTVSWSSFFPYNKYSFNHGKLQDPLKYYVAKLETLMENNTTIHLVIGGNINLFGTIESFAWGENEGSGDIAYDISIKEQRSLGDKTRLAKNIDYSLTYKWKKGDTWEKVCKKMLGDASQGPQNQYWNRKVINKAVTAYRKAHKLSKKKTVKESTALIGYEVVLRYLPDKEREQLEIQLEIAFNNLEKKLEERQKKRQAKLLSQS